MDLIAAVSGNSSARALAPALGEATLAGLVCCTSITSDTQLPPCAPASQREQMFPHSGTAEALSAALNAEGGLVGRAAECQDAAERGKPENPCLKAPEVRASTKYPIVSQSGKPHQYAP